MRNNYEEEYAAQEEMSSERNYSLSCAYRLRKIQHLLAYLCIVITITLLVALIRFAGVEIVEELVALFQGGSNAV